MPYLTQLANVARRTGYPVTEVSGWTSRGHGPQPYVRGIVAHHTAGWDDMHVVRDGRPGLDGPLSQFWLRRDGRIYVVAAGLCWHNAPSTSANHTNSCSIGIEAENDGYAPWPAVQVDAYHRLCAELCKEFELPASRVKGHKEVQPGKPDPHGLNMNTFRADVASAMKGKPTTVEESDVPEVVSLGAGEDQTVPAGGSLSVRWNTEYTDDPNGHNATGVAVMAPGGRWCIVDALVKLRGLVPGDEVDVSWSRFGRDGGGLEDDAWRLTYHGDPDGRVEESVGGQFALNPDNELHLRIVNGNTYPLTLERVSMAKVSMFRR